MDGEECMSEDKDCNPLTECDNVGKVEGLREMAGEYSSAMSGVYDASLDAEYTRRMYDKFFDGLGETMDRVREDKRLKGE